MVYSPCGRCCERYYCGNWPTDKPSAKWAKNVALTPKTSWLTSQRYRQGGFGTRALYERPRPGKAALLDEQHRQRIDGAGVWPTAGRPRACWTVRLLTEEVVKRKLVPRVGRETIRVLLENHDLKPWREKMWCVAELDEEYIQRMEDILAVYEKPLSEREPVVCVDEKPVVLHQEVASSPGHEAGTSGAARRRIRTLRYGQRILRSAAESRTVLPQGDGPPLLA